MENYNHRMDRRSKHKQYGLPGTYHVTIKVNMVYRQALGKVVGNINAVDGSPQAPHVELNEAGRMVEQELTTSITAHYPMIEIQDHVVMPDHLHCIVVVHRDIFSKNGIATHLGQVIAGFKKGCNRRRITGTGFDSSDNFHESNVSSLICITQLSCTRRLGYC